jgi:hypothetical protein
MRLTFPPEESRQRTRPCRRQSLPILATSPPGNGIDSTIRRFESASPSQSILALLAFSGISGRAADLVIGSHLCPTLPSDPASRR